jgi:ATP-dependent RNA helicase DHX57
MDLDTTNLLMKTALEQRLASSEYLDKWASSRSSLPIHSYRDEILRAIDSNRVVVLHGETGCGKSTQLPQFICDHLTSRCEGTKANVICTQPRRIAAVSLAERVAAERIERCGDYVGYQIRLRSRSSEHTRLLYCTVGVLLRKLIRSSDEKDPSNRSLLDRVSHIIVDEVHERQV